MAKNYYYISRGEFANVYQLCYAPSDQKLPEEFLPFAESEVVSFCPSRAFKTNEKPDEHGHYYGKDIEAICIDIYGEPSDNICEVFYTGGGIYCGICKVCDGWFMGETNSWGGVWKTYSQACESFPDEDCGHIRDVNDIEELKEIWTHIYQTVINREDYEAKNCEKWLASLDDELAEGW